jgi:hypothetical protein
MPREIAMEMVVRDHANSFSSGMMRMLVVARVAADISKHTKVTPRTTHA